MQTSEDPFPLHDKSCPQCDAPFERKEGYVVVCAGGHPYPYDTYARLMLPPSLQVVSPARNGHGNGGAQAESELLKLRALLESSSNGTGRGASDAPPTTAAVLVRLADVAPERVRWLWAGRIPLGKLTILEGDPDLGKSTLALDLVARVTAGAAMPDGARGDLDGPSGAVLLSAEDGLADTIRPRLDAAGADCSRVVALTLINERDADGRLVPRLPTLADLDALREAVQRVDAKLVVVDPLMAFVPSRVDTSSDRDVRHVLARLALLAEELGIAVVVVRHLNKSGGTNPKYRGGGSIAFTAAARSVLLVAEDPDNPERRVLARVKGNLAPPQPSLAFRLEGTPEGGVRVAWMGASEYTAAALLAAPPEDRSALDEAKALLVEILASGPRPSKDAQREAREAGVNDRTLRRAREALGVVTAKVGKPGDRGQHWTWGLPGAETPSAAANLTKIPELDHPETVGNFGADGQLRAACGSCRACGGPLPPGGVYRCDACILAEAEDDNDVPF